MRYDNNPTKKTIDGREVYLPKIYPTIPDSPSDIYVATETGDRLDTLAFQFYKDTSLWWIIAAANNSERASLVVEPGIQLRIPTDIENIISNFNNTNR